MSSVVITVATFVLLFLIAINIFVLIMITVNERKNKTIEKPNTGIEDVEKIKILISDEKCIEKINTIINDLIKESVDRYKVLNVNFNGEDAYLPESSVDEMSKYAFGMIRTSITPALRNTIELVYDVSTDEKLDEFLDIRVKLYILREVVETNKDIVE